MKDFSTRATALIPHILSDRCDPDVLAELECLRSLWRSMSQDERTNADADAAARALADAQAAPRARASGAAGTQPARASGAGGTPRARG